MISYNWGNQPVVKRLAKSLQSLGYKIWLDIEQMEGSTLEASNCILIFIDIKIIPNFFFSVATAIEQSYLVLICVSQKYKDSPNCRLEGEYCMNRKVPFIPLMMQKGYKADGWYFSFLNMHNENLTSKVGNYSGNQIVL